MESSEIDEGVKEFQLAIEIEAEACAVKFESIRIFRIHLMTSSMTIKDV